MAGIILVVFELPASGFLRGSTEEVMQRSRLFLAAVLLISAALNATAAQAAPELTQVLPQIRGRLQPSDAIVTELSVISATSDVRFVGREVAFRDVLIERVGQYGFWISTPGALDQVFVIPAEGSLIRPRVGDLVRVRGEIRPMNDHLRGMLHPRYAWDEQVYVRAFTVRPTGLWRRAMENTEAAPPD